MAAKTRRPIGKAVCLHRGAANLVERLCPECGGYKPDANYRHVRRNLNRSQKLRTMGKPINVSAEEYAAARAAIVHAHDVIGMSHRDIAATIDCHWTWPVKVYNNETRTMRRVKYDMIMRHLVNVAYTPARRKSPAGARVPSHGTQRRIRALLADGFTCQFIGEYLGYTLAAASKLAHETKGFVFASTREEVAQAYAKLAGTDPLDYGISGPSSKQMATIAAKYGWAPTSCWDDLGQGDEGWTLAGAIDHADGFPDWTGECGTPNGYFLHLKYGMLVEETTKDGPNKHRKVLCAPCRKSRTEQVMDGRQSYKFGPITEDIRKCDDQPGGRKYGDLAKIARDHGVSIRTVHRMAEKMRSESGSNEVQAK